MTDDLDSLLRSNLELVSIPTGLKSSRYRRRSPDISPPKLATGESNCFRLFSSSRIFETSLNSKSEMTTYSVVNEKNQTLQQAKP